MQRDYLMAALGAVVLACCASGTAQAGNNWNYDTKAISGAACHPSDGKQAGDFTISATGIRNNATTARVVSCPVLLDADSAIVQADSDGTTPSGAEVLYIGFDYSQITATGNVTTKCVLAKQVWNGPITTQAVSYVAAKSADINYLMAQPAMLEGFYSNWGSFSFNCTLPPKVKLAWFMLSEGSSTSGYNYSP